MGQAALNEIWTSVDGKTSVRKPVPGKVVYFPSHSKTSFTALTELGLILIALQILDGILTACGVHLFGTGVEGNRLLRNLMELIGFLPSLVLVKCLAVSVVTWLCLRAYRVWWLKGAFQVIIGIYVCFAIIPWMLILGRHMLS